MADWLKIRLIDDESADPYTLLLSESRGPAMRALLDDGSTLVVERAGLSVEYAVCRPTPEAIRFEPMFHVKQS